MIIWYILYLNYVFLDISSCISDNDLESCKIKKLNSFTLILLVNKCTFTLLVNYYTFFLPSSCDYVY